MSPSHSIDNLGPSAMPSSPTSFDTLWNGKTPTTNQIEVNFDLTESGIPNGVSILNISILGPEWVKVVHLWYNQEQNNGFNTKSKAVLQNKGKQHPKCVAMWQKNRQAVKWHPHRGQL